MIVEVNICSMCGASTKNEPFETQGKTYVVCRFCRDIISYLAESVINKSIKNESK